MPVPLASTSSYIYNPPDVSALSVTADTSNPDYRTVNLSESIVTDAGDNIRDALFDAVEIPDGRPTASGTGDGNFTLSVTDNTAAGAVGPAFWRRR
jgi:hypothetical protein